MIRMWAVICVALLGACKSKASDGQDKGAKAGSGVVAAKPPTGPVPALRWTDMDGEVLLATGSGDRLEGPCGLAGTISATEIELGAGTKQSWTMLIRKDRTFSLPKLNWVIRVGPGGDVTHEVGGTKTPLGKVTGADTDDQLAWFGALVIAAPLIQHKLGLDALDGATKLTLGGAADLRSWDVKGASGDRIAAKRRDDPAPVFTAKPAFDPAKLTVTPQQVGTYLVEVKRDDDATRTAFALDRFLVIENAPGELGWRAEDGKQITPLAKVVGRQVCRAHDQAVGALVWAFLGTDAGAAQLRAADKRSK